MPQDLTDDQSTLVQVIAWCHQATQGFIKDVHDGGPNADISYLIFNRGIPILLRQHFYIEMAPDINDKFLIEILPQVTSTTESYPDI